MEYLIGTILSLGVAVLVTLVGLDRERALYVTALVVIATYYILFAAMGASSRTLVIEILFASGFSLFAIFGFKKNLWLVAAATIGHGLFDLVHHSLVENPGVPRWWPGFCMAFDVCFGGFLAVRLVTRRLPVAN